MEIIYFVFGIVFGGFTLTLWWRHRFVSKDKTQEVELQKLKSEVIKLETEVGFLVKQREEQKYILENLQTEWTNAQKRLGSLEAEKTLILLQEQKNQIFQREQFENLAQKIFEEKTQKFTEQNIVGLNHFFEPFKVQLKNFEKRVEETYSNERLERGNLKGEIARLMELNFKMSNETENLTKALKGDIKTQGHWGEFVLESILDRSGLREGEEYIVQGVGLGLKDSEGGHLRPDILVKLPEDKYLVVDSKVSLKAYEKYVNEENPIEQDRMAKEHVDSLKKHIEGLSGKNYHQHEELGSPEMTLLFMPLEPAFALAFRYKPDLLQFAWERQIAIVSPTTLLTTLKTAASLWKQQRQNKNTLEIAKAGGALYDKFVGLLEGLELLGSRIRQSQDAYEEVLGRISQGKGNLIRQVERLKDLGAKTEKQIESKSLGRQLIAEQIDSDTPSA